ncbi:MAG: YeeE/YedE thiosulfate transporter family protein [Burkholderiales bacterium]
MMLVVDLLIIASAITIGFTAHRASLCNVRAVAEVMYCGTAPMLRSFAKSILWTTLVAGTSVLWLDVPQPTVLARIPIGFAIVGGVTFGIGAAINQGCSLSTLRRLADGDVSMLVTLFGAVAGVATWMLTGPAWFSTSLTATVSPWTRWPVASGTVVFALWNWAMVELWILWRSNDQGSLRDRVLAPTYGLSAAAAIIGVAGGILYALQGAWSFTNFVRTVVGSAFGVETATAWHALLVSALLAGMIGSSIQRRSFSLQTAALSGGWRRRFGGGWLMGLGGALIPGGNDTLLLSSLPALSLQATFAYAAMLAGIAATLFAMKRRSSDMGIGMRAPDLPR